MVTERIEESILNSRQKNTANSLEVFRTSGSAGNNPQRLAQLLTGFDLAMAILGWQDKPLANLTKFVTGYQASLDAKYHEDFKDVLIAEEIERKRAERKGISVMSQ